MTQVTMKKETLVEIICLLFVFLFMYASVSKLIDVEKFQVQISQSPLLTNYAWWISWIVPSAEILISILLVIRRSRTIALHAAFGLMAIFTTYIIAILLFSENVPCSCGGILDKMGWNEHLIFNIMFVILGFVGIMLSISLHQTADKKDQRNEQGVLKQSIS